MSGFPVTLGARSPNYADLSAGSLIAWVDGMAVYDTRFTDHALLVKIQILTLELADYRAQLAAHVAELRRRGLPVDKDLEAHLEDE